MDYTYEFRWFFGVMKKKEADKQLHSDMNQYGSYLIRSRATHPGRYTLSVRDREIVKHYRIRQLENGRFCFVE